MPNSKKLGSPDKIVAVICPFPIWQIYQERQANKIYYSPIQAEFDTEDGTRYFWTGRVEKIKGREIDDFLIIGPNFHGRDRIIQEAELRKLRQWRQRK